MATKAGHRGSRTISLLIRFVIAARTPANSRLQEPNARAQQSSSAQEPFVSLTLQNGLFNCSEFGPWKWIIRTLDAVEGYTTRSWAAGAKTQTQESISQTRHGKRCAILLISQSAAASADLFVCASVVAPTDLAVISSPFLFISNLCFRSKPLTNSRAALATAPGRLDASTLTVDSTVSSFRSR
jgi:hypothetical protein